jgi:hypothetical protein
MIALGCWLTYIPPSSHSQRLGIYTIEASIDVTQSPKKRKTSQVDYLLSYRQITRYGFYGAVFFLARAFFEGIDSLSQLNSSLSFAQGTSIAETVLIPILIMFLMYKSDY